MALVIGAISLNGQVTIGSGQTPNPGALLDLKQDGTTTKGLKLPVVSLSDPDNLFPMFTDDGSNGYVEGTKATEDPLHAGLTVYNTTYCDGQFAKGMYVWSGNSWEQITDNPVYSAAYMSFTTDTLHLPSGMDARTSAASTLPFTWDAATHVDWSTRVNTIGGGLLFSQAYAHMTPASQTWATSPSVLSVYPDDMTSALVTPANPWRTRESKTTITAYSVDCPPTTKELVLNQTNYALKVNNSFNNTAFIYTGIAGTENINVQGNAAWKTTITQTLSGAAVVPATGGKNLRNNNNSTTVSVYSPTATSKYNVADITFSDTESTKRFNDITVSVLNCSSTASEPTIEGWAKIIGFTQPEIDAVTDAQAGSSALKNGYQLHRDQNGNLFISGSFGATAGRWMLHNVRATSYAATGRTDGTTVVSPNVIDVNFLTSYSALRMAFPGGTNGSTPAERAADDTYYKQSERIGRVYNWAAATMGKGGIDGLLPFAEGETDTDPNHAKVQGICPNGWHLPSDVEWTELEQEISDNTSLYSGLVDDGTAITPGVLGLRGSTHGQGMKDVCNVPGYTTLSNGKSNILSSSAIGGFGVMCTGSNHSGGGESMYGTNSYFFSSSGTTSGAITSSVYVRRFQPGTGQVERSTMGRVWFAAARCKKD
ncbi:hypothetical protein D0T66_11325 [Dysgonomonas sp. 25]|nr:hypothetical protein [Dysgonomonas sp. 25]